MNNKVQNYTSAVPVNRTIMEIEDLLAQSGASHIGKTYDGSGEVDGFFFQMPVNGQSIGFKLPCKPMAVEAIMRRGMKRPRAAGLKKLHEQSRRTAWRILRDWTQSQLTMIQLEQMDPLEVFLSHSLRGGEGQTLYESLKDNGFKLLGSGEK